jgi:hypothetical protein
MAVYETSNGNIYEFSFERQLDGSIRAYIVKQPDYGSRESSCHITHRLTARHGTVAAREHAPGAETASHGSPGARRNL